MCFEEACSTGVKDDKHFFYKFVKKSQHVRRFYTVSQKCPTFGLL